MRSLAEVVRETELDPASGLDAAAVARSREKFGANQLTPLPRDSAWKKFIEKFDDPIIKILLAAALLSLLVDLFRASATVGGISLGGVIAGVMLLLLLRLRQGIPPLLFVAAFILFGVGGLHGHLLVEGLAVMIAVLLATGVAFLSEYRSDREFEVLNARRDTLQSRVVRGGNVHSVLLEEIVVGDVIVLEMGDEIPADGRLFSATELAVDQSLMTGESEPVHKSAEPGSFGRGFEQPGCLYRGTQVVDGVARLVVTEVGDETALGALAKRLSSDINADDATSRRVKSKLTVSKDLTPLQQKLTDLAGIISRVGYTAALFIFVAELIRGLMRGSVYWPTTGPQVLDVLGELLDYFVTMVIIIVVAVPEGLPMSVTVSLALAMRKMTRANSLVRQLVACETIGSATVICSDKTGTLTQNKMRVDRLSCADQSCARGSPTWPRVDASFPWPESGNAFDAMAVIAAVNSTANLEEKGGKTQTLGNITEGALLRWLRDNDGDYRQIRARFPVLYQMHFSSDRKRMTTITRHGGRIICLVKGAPERVLDQCSLHLTTAGAIAPLDSDMRRRIEKEMEAAARQAMRVLAFAYAILPDDMPTDEEALHARRDELDRNLVYAGFAGIRDPLRDEVKAALDECREAGIRVMMITGDNVLTARAIAHEVGLVASLDEPVDVPGGAILTSPKLNQMDDEAIKQALPGLRVLARAMPLDKYRLVRLLQEMGEVVAVTGDGTNDAPALKRADVGLSMGIAGTEVSKEASKIVLLDDSFATIVRAVHWGRALYENIQRFLQFQLTINISALAIMFLGIVLFDVRAPFTVLQLLWINVIMDTFAAIALCSEPPRAGIMRSKPKRRDESIVTRAMLGTILWTSSFFVIVMLSLLFLLKGDPDQPGMLAGDGAWSAEVGPVRKELPAEALTRDEAGTWIERATGDDATIHFTVFQATLFFTIYVFFQIWNQVNCRSLTPRTSGLRRLLDNPVFLTIAALTAMGQILIVQYGGRLFKVQPMDWRAWLGVMAFTSSVLVFAEIARWIRRMASS